jgi:hypothetical protein
MCTWLSCRKSFADLAWTQQLLYTLGTGGSANIRPCQLSSTHQCRRLTSALSTTTTLKFNRILTYLKILFMCVT